MLPSTFSRLRQGLTHVTDTGRCPMPCPNPTEVARLRQLFLCCSRSGTSPSFWAFSVLFPALRLSRAAVCAATELSVRCSQDLFNLRTISVLCPNRRGEPVVTGTSNSYHNQREYPIICCRYHTISQNNQIKMDKKQERINPVKVEKLINENEGRILVSSD